MEKNKWDSMADDVTYEYGEELNFRTLSNKEKKWFEYKVK